MNIPNSKDCLLTLSFLFSHFGNNLLPSWTSKERRPLTIINMDLLRFFVLGKKAIIIISLELPSHHITHRHPIFWIS
jgi:hypothetical protein